MYKGQYVVLSGENSFDEITGYQWSDGSTGSQTGFFAEQDTTVSLIVTNPYGSDTAVVTIKVVDLPVIEDVTGEYRIITVQQIPVDPVPYQEFAVILNGQNCFITLRQMGDFIYMSLRVDNTVIYNNLICDVLTSTLTQTSAENSSLLILRARLNLNIPDSIQDGYYTILRTIKHGKF